MGKRRVTRLRSAALILALALAMPATAHAERDAAYYGNATFDVIVLRPLGFAASLIGFALFIPAAFMTAPGGSEGIEQAWEQFVVTPAEHVYVRPLGEF